MDVFEAIKMRRSIRMFKDEPIEEQLLDEIMEAARWAPSGGNTQRRRFIVITSKPILEAVRKVSPGIFSRPAALVVICLETLLNETARAKATDRYWRALDCAVAAQTLVLAATGRGLGSCIAGSFSPLALKELLDIPETIEPVLLVTLGHSAETPKAPPRVPFEEIVFRDTYGKKWRT